MPAFSLDGTDAIAAESAIDHARRMAFTQFASYRDAKGNPAPEQGYRLAQMASQCALLLDRMDAAGMKPQADRYRADALGAKRDGKLQMVAFEPASGVKRDSFDASAALFMAREIEYKYTDILRQEFPATDALTYFPIDQSVPLGARQHTATMIFQNTDVAVYRGGDQRVPQSDISRQEQIFPIHYYVSSFEYDMFEMVTSNFANFPIVAEKLLACREGIAEFLNRMSFFGDADNKISGVLAQYPAVINQVSVATPFTDASSPDAIIAALAQLANFAASKSKNLYWPTAMAMSPRMRDYIFNRPRNLSSDKSVGQWFIENNSYIKKIDAMWELADRDGTGRDAILCYRPERSAMANVVVSPFSTLPVQIVDFRFRTLAYAVHGGVIMRKPLNNIVGYAKVANVAA